MRVVILTTRVVIVTTRVAIVTTWVVIVTVDPSVYRECRHLTEVIARQHQNPQNEKG